LNADCKPENLYQYAILGSLYAKGALGVENPRIALLNIGEEESKGNLVTKAAYELMNDTKDFNFVGNIESNELMTGKKADVIVCDGFVGNVILKMAESFYRLAAYQGIETEFFSRLNYESQGGTPVLGVNAPVIIGHGSSSPKAIKNMILNTEKTIKAKMLDRVKDIFKDSHFNKKENTL
jgi:glycerol-3-phosphate acyltransferase PlsX